MSKFSDVKVTKTKANIVAIPILERQFEIIIRNSILNLLTKYNYTVVTSKAKVFKV